MHQVRLFVLNLFVALAAAQAGTVITSNLSSDTVAIVNIDARVDGCGNYSQPNPPQAFWYQPTPTAPSVTLPAGTYRFRIVDPADAATLYPALTSAQLAQIYTAWTYNSPWIENYMVFKSSALGNPSESQIFDGAPAEMSYSSAQAAYDGSVANGTFNKIRPAPPGRAGDASSYLTEYTFTEQTTILFAVPDVGLFDNSGGVSVAISSAPARLKNISTRLRVLTGDKVGIGGFIISGTGAKRVLIRGIGPSLAAPPFNVPGTLPDPQLSLHTNDAQGHDMIVATNDNWKTADANGQSQEAEITASGLAPANPSESAILLSLNPGAYTAVLSGKSNGIGNALVDAYDLDEGNSGSFLSNISTRAVVDTGDQVMIGGFILGPQTGASATVLVRVIGLSLTPFGVSGALANPTLELHDSQGALLAANDDWQTDAEANQIPADRIPADPKESALHRALSPGAYTAIVRGANDTTGVALVEVYYLSTP